MPLQLYPTLRVQSVIGQDGTALQFIQEDKNDDSDFYVILPKPLDRGAKYSVTTTYSGKDAVFNEGAGNYYPVARDDWYPSNPGARLSDYTSYDMTFRMPKGMKIAATGSLVSESEEGGQSVSVWKSDVDEAVAGFQFGRMKEEERQADFTGLSGRRLCERRTAGLDREVSWRNDGKFKHSQHDEGASVRGTNRGGAV